MRNFSLLFILICLLSCNSKQVMSTYTSLPSVWEKDQQISFDFNAPDSIQAYNLFLTVRNNNAYDFSNLFVITTLKTPQNNTVVDTLEYAMAKTNGAWLGTGFSEIKESKLWYKEHFMFPQTGTYTLSIEHAMRKNGNVLGVSSLKGIMEIGFSIEHLTHD